jgi:hypothetical protein
MDNFDDPPPPQFCMIKYDSGNQTTFGSSRQTFFSIEYVPSVSMNGEAVHVGGESYSYYLNWFNTKRNVPTDVTIQLWAENTTGTQYRATARVTLLPEATASRTMRIYIVYVQDHYNSTSTYARNVCRYGTLAGTYTFAPGETRDFQALFTTTNPDTNRRVIAFAQENRSTAPAQVYQAAMRLWPWPTPPAGACCLPGGECEVLAPAACTTAGGTYNGDGTTCESNPCGFPGDMNCSGAVDFDDIDPFVLALSGEEGYEAQYPDCQWLNGDIDHNGAVDFDDIDPFVALLGG